ncbi:hypothetical protein ACA910_001503 [Epithemia clementina (nom. ined.)]
MGDPQFLLDMKRLAQAMVQLITQSKLTLLSYHCHALPPPSMLGVSCIGVMLESHVSLHTWPKAGILTMSTYRIVRTQQHRLIPCKTILFRGLCHRLYGGLIKSECTVILFTPKMPHW